MMSRWFAAAVLLTTLCSPVSADCSDIRKNENKPQTSFCPYTLVSPSTYHYYAGADLHLRLDGNKASDMIGFFEVKFVDNSEQPVGLFIEGGQLCERNAVLVHQPYMKQTRSVKFKWRSPGIDIGPITLRLTVGVNKHMYWSNCKMADFDLKLVYDKELSTLAPITRRPTTQSVADHPVGFEEAWCKPDRGSPVYRPVKGSGCRQYQATVGFMPENYTTYNTIDCSQYTMFDTSTCVCGHILRVKCHVP